MSRSWLGYVTTGRLLLNSVSTSVESLYRHQIERGSIFPKVTQPSGTMSGI